MIEEIQDKARREIVHKHEDAEERISEENKKAKLEAAAEAVAEAKACAEAKESKQEESVTAKTRDEMHAL